MKSISRPKNNIGGIARLYSCPIECLTSISQSGTPGQYQITLSSTDEVYDISAIAESIRATEQPRESPAGTYYEHQIQATLAKDTPELSAALEELAGKRLIMIYRDQNNRYKLVGSQTECMRIAASKDSGARIQDLQKAELTFSGRSVKPARWIADPFA